MCFDLKGVKFLKKLVTLNAPSKNTSLSQCYHKVLQNILTISKTFFQLLITHWKLYANYSGKHFFFPALIIILGRAKSVGLPCSGILGNSAYCGHINPPPRNLSNCIELITDWQAHNSGNMPRSHRDLGMLDLLQLEYYRAI